MSTFTAANSLVSPGRITPRTLLAPGGQSGRLRLTVCSPHVRRWTVVTPKTFLGLFEMPANDVHEWVDRHFLIGIERIQIIDCDQPGQFIPLMVTKHFVGLLQVRLRFVVLAKRLKVAL